MPARSLRNFPQLWLVHSVPRALARRCCSPWRASHGFADRRRAFLPAAAGRRRRAAAYFGDSAEAKYHRTLVKRSSAYVLSQFVGQLSSRRAIASSRPFPPLSRTSSLFSSAPEYIFLRANERRRNLSREMREGTPPPLHRHPVVAVVSPRTLFILVPERGALCARTVSAARVARSFTTF